MVLPREGSLSERAVLGGKQQSSGRGGQQPPISSLLLPVMHKGFVPQAHGRAGTRGQQDPLLSTGSSHRTRLPSWLRAGALSNWMGRAIQPWPHPQLLP